MRSRSWVVEVPGQPMVLQAETKSPAPGEVLVEVAGCGVCHTDLGFFYDGVPTRHPLPARRSATRSAAASSRPAPARRRGWAAPSSCRPCIPCGECAACRAGRGRSAPSRSSPATTCTAASRTHVRVPARGLCPVPDLGDPRVNPARLDLAALSVIADAVSTPYQAILRSGLRAGRPRGLRRRRRRGRLRRPDRGGARRRTSSRSTSTRSASRSMRAARRRARRCDAGPADFKALRKQVRDFAEARGDSDLAHEDLRDLGHAGGPGDGLRAARATAAISRSSATRRQTVELRLSNLMAFDATAQGNWGCLPEHYPAVVDLVLSGRVALEPVHRAAAARRRSTSRSPTCTHGAARGRIVLIPEA